MFNFPAMRGGRGLLVAAISITCGLSNASAGVIFTESFNGYAGNQNASQVDTGDPVAFGGSVAGWTGAGSNALHAVRLGTGNWAIMLYNNNTITLTSGIAANTALTNYFLTFDYGTANYAAENQGTIANNGLIVEVLRADNTVLAMQSYLPGAWGPGNYDFQAGLQGALSYTGDGSGNVRVKVLTVNPSGMFGGSIDNLSWSSAPEPGGLALAGPCFGILAWVVRKRGQASN